MADSFSGSVGGAPAHGSSARRLVVIGKVAWVRFDEQTGEVSGCDDEPERLRDMGQVGRWRRRVGQRWERGDIMRGVKRSGGRGREEREER